MNKITLMEMENSLEGFNRFERGEKRMRKPEGSSIEIIQSEE